MKKMTVEIPYKDIADELRDAGEHLYTMYHNLEGDVIIDADTAADFGVLMIRAAKLIELENRANE